MIIWGGVVIGDPYADLKTGFRYDPVLDAWKAMNRTGAINPHRSDVTVWTGKELLVCHSSHYCTRYDPDRDSWAAATPPGKATPRQGRTAV